MISNWLDGVLLAYPWVLWGLGIIPVYLFKLWWAQKKHPTIFFSGFQTAKQSRKSWWNLAWLIWLKQILVVAMMGLFILVLARPQSVTFTQWQEKVGIDIFFGLDVSESMLAEDLQPNRLEAAKTYVAEFLDQLTQDRAGIMVFAGKPFVQAPLTFDYEVLKYYLNEVSIRTINQRIQFLGGTAVGDAILEAKRRLGAKEERSRVLILVTDGASNVGLDPLIGARYARSQGIRIYTIGVGAKDGVPIPVGVQNGEKIYAKHPDGRLVLTSFNEGHLKEIAEISGGAYFYAQDNQALKRSFQAIEKLERGSFKIQKQADYQEEFLAPLLVLLGLSLLYIVIESLNPVKV